MLVPAVTAALGLVAPLAAQADENVFCGRSLGHRHIQGVEVPCPELRSHVPQNDARAGACD